MHYLGFETALADREDFSLSGVTFLNVFSENGAIWLLAGSTATNSISRFSINEGAILSASGVYWRSNGAGYGADEALSISVESETRLMTFDHQHGAVSQLVIEDAITPGSLLNLLDQEGDPVLLAAMTSFAVENATFLAGARPDGTGLLVYRFVENWRVMLQIELPDTPKAAVAGTSSIIEIKIGETVFLVSASQTESGLTSFRFQEDGSVSMTDSIAAEDGLWVSGYSQIAHATVDAQEFVVCASPGSSTLSVVRLNPMGVFFVSDIENDTRETRFQNISALETFNVGERSFIIAGGSDAGLSLYELLPGGDLHHHQSLSQTGSWQFGPIETIRAAVLDAEVQIFVTGTARGGIAQFTFSLDRLGVQQTGSSAADSLEGAALDDVLIGFSGNDRLQGGDGNDTLFDGTGIDTLEGGHGADIFVLTGDGQEDTVRQFQKGTDRLDVSDWGMIYDHTALTFRAHRDGATITYRDEVLHIRTMDSRAISSALWDADDFIF
ncbi:hypothetical protein [Shimia sp. SDUM112013]|uniref:calcium-binding protein n=1 Tax=Shimia sp. SDUM112013 TaxID=3136160 RepID=UPI0032EDF8A0